MNQAKLHSQWHHLATRLSFGHKTAEDAWIFLNNHYQASQRHYHTLSHIGQMLQAWEALDQSWEDATALQYAIWFHDVIYTSYRKDNEKRSAETALRWAEALSVSSTWKAKVHQLILATQTHQLSSDDPDLPWMLDMDLMILGAEPEAYIAYTRAIRKEYRMYPDFLYRPGRAKVLDHFLQRPRIYYTDYFRDQLEAQARQNLADERKQLKGT
ncbi:MAG: hypothetical protein AAFQ92_03540 [Bacteroidota bacterium]